MCGIVGKFLYDRDGVVEAAGLKRMCDTIVHRGPDDEGVFVSGPIGLGMRRLSIIDLSGGHQPMTTPDGRLTIVFNGEIYNYRDIRRVLEQKGVQFRTASDTECVLHAYALYGVECLRDLNGMFAIAVWDQHRRELFLARDRIGVKPLYLHSTAEGIAFASEVKALLSDPTVPRRLDPEAFQYFLRYGYVPSPATLLAGIGQVPPGHYILANSEGFTLRRYWTLSARLGESRSEEEHADLVYELLKASVQRQLVSDVPLGAFLSGGLDSSSMVHLMSELTGAPVSTYSIGFAGVDAFHNELDDARRVATRYGTTHHEIIVRPDATALIPRLVHHLDQPLADSSFIVTYLVSALARETVKVIISGVGGDELFGGYRRYLGPYLSRSFRTIPAPARRAVAALARRLPVDRGSAAKNVFRLARSFITADGLPAYERYDAAVQILSPRELSEVSRVPHFTESDLFGSRQRYFHVASESDPLAQMQLLDFNTSLVDSLLLLTDKMSMAVSLEARVPFLDHELVEAVSAMPSSIKIKRGRLRYIQRKAMAGRLPDGVLKKKKRGFGCPVGAWFRDELRPLLRDTLASRSLESDGLLNPAKVQTLIEEHEQFREDRTDVLLALLTFQLWRRQWNVT